MTWIEKYPVCGSTGNPYVVARSDHKLWGCSCPYWTRNVPRPTCKHIKMVIKLLATNPKFKPVFEGEIESKTAVAGGPADEILRAIILEDK